MNIFVLDLDPKKAAQTHCDKHVVKMICESVQMISTVIRKQFPNADVYKSTHRNHPCTIWAGESQANMNWLCELTQGLLDEYTLRYDKKHASGLVFERCKTYLSDLNYSKSGLTEFAQAMPEYYKSKDVVTAYRNYYIAEKSHMLNYKTQKPDWL